MVAVFWTGAARAQTDFVKENNGTALSLAASYTNNSGIPGAADRIIVTNNFTQTNVAPLGGNLSVSNITFAGNWPFQINPTAGAELTIGAGGIDKLTSSNFTIGSAVRLAADQTWNINSERMQVNGVFTDAGYKLQVNGAGIFDLRPSTEVTYGPNVTIDTTVQVNSSTAIVNLGGTNTFNSITVFSGRVRGDTIGDFGVASSMGDGGTSTAIGLGGGGTTGVFEYTGATTAANRTFNRDARSAGSGIEVSNAATTLTLGGNLGSGSQSNSSDNGWLFGGAGNLVLNGTISDSTGTGSTGTTIKKKDSGLLVLGGNNTFSGATEISNGVVRITRSNALGTTAGGTTVRAGAALELSNGITTTAEALTLNGTGVGSAGALRNVSGANTYSGAVTLASDASVRADGATTLTVSGGVATAGFGLTAGGAGTVVVSGAITGAGSLTKDGAGALTLTSDGNNHSGGTLISGGTLRVGNGGSTGALAPSGGVTNNAGLVFDRTGELLVSVGISGPGSLTNAGTGTVTLSGAGSFTGGTVLSAGTLVLSNTSGESLGGTSSIQVDAGAALVLADNDEIGDSTGLILNGGTFRTGVSTGYSDTLGTLTLSASSTIDLGNGVHTITFADSKAVTWAANAILTITNWQGMTRSPGVAGSILFGVNGLSDAQLAQVYWAPQNITGGLLLGGELVPIPEPRVYAAALALLGAVAWRERRRIVRLFGPR